MNGPSDAAASSATDMDTDQINDEISINASNGQSDSQMTISSNEVNYLIFRYMQESGFVHSAFSFAHESMLGRTGLRSEDKNLPPGALISFLQKGLQYVGMEESLRQDNSSASKESRNTNALDTAVDFSLLSPAAVASVSRPQPPIQLNVPPATAAAAVKARLEAEEKMRSARQAAALSNQLSGNGSLAAPSAVAQAASAPPPGVPPQPHALDDANALTRQALAAQAAAAISQLQHISQQTHPSMSVDQHAAVFAAQQHQAAAAEILALQHGIRVPMESAPADSLDVRRQPPQPAEATLPVAAPGGKRAASVAKRSVKKQKGKAMDLTGSSFSSREGTSSETPAAVSKPMKADRTNDPSSAYSLPKQELINGESDRNGTSNSSELVHVNGELGKGNDAGEDSEIIEVNAEDIATNAPENQILRLEMHQSEVFMCAWNPVFTDLIATGSGDASARIWQMGGTHAQAGLTTVKLLPHGSDPRDRKNKDVTTLEWSSDGALLATGSYDGVARVWARNGALIHTLRGHNGPIFSLKWNKQGNYLLSGSYDKTTIVWDVSGSTGVVQQQFTDHQAPALDVDWKDSTTFASCSTDKTVHICRVGEPRPLKVFSGHADEVNAVKWDPSGKYLASCSDDCTAKVWDVESDRTDPLYDFQSHQQEIYTVKWSPTGPGSRNPEKMSILATASFDGSVRLWNIADGSCYRVFNRHRDSVYSVAFSPSGDFLASGSLAGQLYIWNIQQAKHIKSYKGKGDIFDVAWNMEETRVAACFSSNVVSIIDFDRSAYASG